MNPVRPEINEARLTHMAARASRIWRGESAPSVILAEDVLLLVAEVRRLQENTVAIPSSKERKFSVFASVFGKGGLFEQTFGKDYGERTHHSTFEKYSKASYSKSRKDKW